MADADASDEPMRGRGHGKLRNHTTHRGHLGESDSSAHPAEESDSAGSEPDADSSDESMSGRRRGGRRGRGRGLRRATSPSMPVQKILMLNHVVVGAVNVDVVAHGVAADVVVAVTYESPCTTFLAISMLIAAVVCWQLTSTRSLRS